MAKKVESFKVNEKKKTIILYNNVERNSAEQSLIEFYLLNGYKPMIEEKKPGITKEEMLEKMKGYDEYLADFNTAYSLKANDKNAPGIIEGIRNKYGIKPPKKDKPEVGFHLACKIFAVWQKKYDKKDKK